jgi:hypothetical protein
VIKGDRKTKDASDGDVQENVETEIFKHADQHEQSGVDVSKLRAVEGGRKAGDVNNGNEFRVKR